MKSIIFILLALLGAWWTLLIGFLVWNHRKRVQEARTPLTAEEREECRKLEESIPREQVTAIDFIIMSPLMLVFLPLYLYGWLVKDPYTKQNGP